MKSKIMFGVLILVIGIISFSYAKESINNINISNAWIRSMPPSQKNTAAYMIIQNETDKELILKSVSFDLAEIVELHKMSHVDGVMKMEKVEEIKISAKSKASLEPGGFHIMLINLKHSLKKGSKHSIVLNFQDGAQMEAKAIVADEAVSSAKACCLHHQ